MRSYCTIKSKQARIKKEAETVKKQVRSYPAKKLPAIHSTVSIATICVFLHSYFGRHNYQQYKAAKVGIKSFRFARECVSFMHAWV